jgi:hypothetical protein
MQSMPLPGGEAVETCGIEEGSAFFVIFLYCRASFSIAWYRCVSSASP